MIDLTVSASNRVRVKALAAIAPLVAGGISSSRVTASAQSDEEVTLNLWLFEGEDQLLPALKAAYEEANPNITVEITLIPEDQYVVKMDTALAADSPPDIGFLYEDRWIKTDNVLPLDDMIAANEIDLSQFNQAVVQGQFMREGVTYALGSYVAAVVLLYNKAMFDAAGIDYPSATDPMTVDEYAALAAQLTVDDDDINQKVWGGSSEAPYWWMNRNTMFSEDGRQTEGLVNDEATKNSYEVLAGMVADGDAPSGSIMQTLGTEGSEALFLQGKVAMAIVDFAGLAALDESGIEYGVAALPVEVEGDPVFLPIWSDGMCVFADSEHPEEAMDFLAFLATEGQRIRVEVTGEAPISLSAAEEYGWTEQGNTEARQQFLDAASQAVPAFFVPGFWDVTAPLGDVFNQVAEGQRSASDALDEVAPRMQDSLDLAWETWEDLG